MLRQRISLNNAGLICCATAGATMKRIAITERVINRDRRNVMAPPEDAETETSARFGSNRKLSNDLVNVLIDELRHFSMAGFREMGFVRKEVRNVFEVPIDIDCGNARTTGDFHDRGVILRFKRHPPALVVRRSLV